MLTLALHAARFATVMLMLVLLVVVGSPANANAIIHYNLPAPLSPTPVPLFAGLNLTHPPVVLNAKHGCLHAYPHAD